jgi:Protein of unknown function (DUF1549)
VTVRFFDISVSRISQSGLLGRTPCFACATGDNKTKRREPANRRVNTTATVWLGTTLSCAQCHDHKYDPFSQRDYYRFFAYFNNTAAETTSSGSTREFIGPKLALPLPPEKEVRRKALQARRDALDRELKKAGWLHVATVLLNLDETITKG